MARDFTQLNEKEVLARLASYPAWRLKDGRLVWQGQFTDFAAAFAFLGAVAAAAERLRHHPIIWNSYNQVRLEVFTHKLNGLSTADFDLLEELTPLLPPTNEKR